MKQTKINRIASIEILRFFSSLMILIWHYQHFFNPYNIFSEIEVLKEINIQPLYNLLSIIYTHGQIGVDIFFAISGFVFCYIYVNSENKITIKNFWVNRFARLYPLHFLTLIIVLFLQKFSFNEYGSYQITKINDLYHFILNLFFVSGWGFAEDYSFNSPIWSVSLELIAYAIFLFSLVNAKKLVFIKAFSILVLLVLLRKLDLVKNVNFIALQSIIYYTSIFYTGVLVYFFVNKFKKNYLQFLVSIILISLAYIGNFKILLFCPGLLMLFLAFENYLGKKIRKIFCSLGDLTYSMYLLHVPTQISLILIFQMTNIEMNIFLKTYFFIFYISLIILISYLSFHIFEKNLNKKIRNYFDN